MRHLAHHVWRKARVTQLANAGPEYCEKHRVSGWALLPLGAVGVVTVWGWTSGLTYESDPRPAIAAGVALIVLVGAASIRVVIAVNESGFIYRVWPLYWKQIPLSDIAKINEFTVAERWMPMPRGSKWYIPAVHGVRILLADGKGVSVSAEHAHLLARALEAARQREHHA
jgi:hypothetical protein